jgi:PAS domain S-box-containing protein
MKRLGTAVVHALEEKQVRLERQRAERALRESEERFRGLYENATIGIYRTTPNGRILMANPAAVRLLGYDSFEEISQRNLEEGGFEPSYSRKGFRDQIEKDEVISGLESAWVKKDGSIVFVRESARAIRDENGKTLYYDGTFEDITERKVAEQSLLESEARYRARTEELEALFTLSTRLREAQTADDMLPVILGEMRRVLDTDACEIRLLDATGERLLVALSEGASAARTGTTFGRDVGIAGHVMRTRQPYVTNDGSSQNSGVGG